MASFRILHYIDVSADTYSVYLKYIAKKDIDWREKLYITEAAGKVE